MKVVGIRELKDRLSEYIRMVVSGEALLVTDRGEVVAEIRKPGKGIAETPYPRLLLHAGAGKARLGSANRPDLYPARKSVLRHGTARDLLEAERGDR